MADTGQRESPTNGNGPLTIKEQMRMPWPELIASTLKRPVALASKIISFKGATIILATFLLAGGMLESWHWIIMVGAIVLGRDILDKFKK